MHTHRGSHSFIIAVLAWVVLLQTLGPCASGEVITRPEKRLLLGAPYYAGYAPESNQIILGNRGGIHAFDIDSGEERWSNSNSYAGALSGRKRIVAWIGGVAAVLDKATGEAVWWCEENRYGAVSIAFFSPDETRIITVFKEGFAVHTVGRHTQRAYSGVKNRIVGWMPDNKTLLLAQGTAEQYCWFTGKLQYMDVDTGAITDACTLPVLDKTLFPSLSSAGELAVPSMAGEGATGLKIYALQTGALLRDLGEIPFNFGHVQWTYDAKHISFLTWDNSRCCLLNAATGGLEANLFKDGQFFEQSYIGEGTQASGWAVSQDHDMNYWLWPLTGGGRAQADF